MQFTRTKIIELHQDIQMLQAKTSVGTTIVGSPSIYEIKCVCRCVCVCVCVPICLSVCSVSLFFMHGHRFERICTKFGMWHLYTLQMVMGYRALLQPASVDM